jgi:hypothetical protein
MGNRILKETIRTSKKINSLTDFQFRVWAYLVTYVDDYGRGSADPELLKGLVFPRRKRLTESDIEKTLTELAGKGCISLYEIDGESYFYFPNWGDHQRVQTKKSKFPAPQESTVSHGESPWVTVGDGESPPNPIQYESNPNPNPNPNTKEKAPTHARGEYGWVKLTDAQYANLVEKLGETELKRCITYVDQSAQGNGNKNGWKDWNLVVQRCHREGWGLRSAKNNTPKPDTPEQRHQSAQNLKADMDWMDEFLSGGGV